MAGDSRPYEQQVIEALKAIARGVGATGISASGGSSSSLNSSTVAGIITAINGVASRVESINSLLEILRTIMVYDDEEEGMNFKSGIFADTYVVAGGICDDNSGGGGLVEHIWRYNDLGRTFSDYDNDTFDAYAINSLHLRISELERNPGGVTSVVGRTGDVTSTHIATALIADGKKLTDTTYKLQVNGSWKGDSASGTSLGTIYAPTTAGTQGYALIADSNGLPAWSNISGLYLPIAGGNMTGDITFNHNNGVYFKNGGGTSVNGIKLFSNVLNVGSTSQVSRIYGTSVEIRHGSDGYLGMKIDSDGEIYIGRTVAAGNTYLAWDETNNAWHLSGNLIADGYVVSGGLCSDDEVITGITTFNDRSLVITDDYTAASPKYVNLVVDSSNVLHFYSDKTTTSSWANLKCNSVTQVSDVRLKENILSLSKDYAIEKLMQLKPVTWIWNKKCCYAGTPYSGFIAQDVKGVIPQMVHDGDKYLSMDYAMLHAFEVAGLQSHEARIAALERENAELKRRLGYE